MRANEGACQPVPPDLSAFGSFDLVRPLLGGHLHSVWLVADIKGHHWVAKSTGRDQPALDWLTPVQAAARRAGWIVPTLQRTADGLCAAGGWTLEPFVAGQLATPADITALASRIDAFHRAAVGLPQRPGAAALPDHMISDHLGDIDLTAMPPHLVAACRAAWAPFADWPTCAIHGDLGPGNVLLTPDGPALIDWDEARRDLPFLDLIYAGQPNAAMQRAHRAREIACGWQREPSHARHLARDFA
jgi:hypothetical protein